MHRVVLENLKHFQDRYPAELLHGLIRIAEIDDARMYLVGGTIRDCLLGRISHDLDIAVSCPAMASAKMLQRELGGGTLVDLSGPEDEAVRLVWRGEQVDFSTFREGAVSIDEDLRHRDFTVNAMAVFLPEMVGESPDRTLFDPTGGLADLRERRVKHCPGAFAADPLRLLRGYRLCATLGFHQDTKTNEAIASHAGLINKVAAERISYELRLIFDSPRTAGTLQDMAATGLLRQLLPELYAGEGVEQPEFHHLDVLDHCFLALRMMENIIAEPERYFPGRGEKVNRYLDNERVRRCLKWAALMHDIGKPSTKEFRADKDGRVTFYRHDEVGMELFQQFAERSKWSRAETELVGGLINMHMHPFHLCNVQRVEGVSKRAALKLCRRAASSLTGLFILAMSDSLAGKGEKKPERMEEELLTLFDTVGRIYEENIAPVLHGPRLLTGRDLVKECKLDPGPLFAEILDEVEAARVEGKVVDRASALAWVKKFMQDKKG